MKRGIEVWEVLLIVGGAIIDLILFNNIALNKDHINVVEAIK